MTSEPTSTALCCTTPRALCFCAGVFLLVYGAFHAAALWRPELYSFAGIALLASIGVACVANFWRNRTVHCAVTGPLFLIAAAAALVSPGLAAAAAGLAVVGTGAGFVLEALVLRGQAARTER